VPVAGDGDDSGDGGGGGGSGGGGVGDVGGVGDGGGGGGGGNGLETRWITPKLQVGSLLSFFPFRLFRTLRNRINSRTTFAGGLRAGHLHPCPPRFSSLYRSILCSVSQVVSNEPNNYFQ